MSRLVLFATLVAMFSCLAWAGDETKILDSAAQVLQSMVSSHQIPSPLLDQAKCIAVIPKLTQAGLLVGGKHGNGAVSCRTASGWGAPAFVTISGGSVGLQAGAEHQDLVLLMNSQGADQLKSGHWDLGAGASAAGPNGGQEAIASTGWKAPVLSYSNASGAFAGAGVGGSKIGQDKDAIHNIYGKDTTFEGILDGQVQPTAAAQQFMSALPK